jgi:hypothetical protein
MVTRSVRTDGTDIIIGNHPALPAILYLVAHTVDSCREMMYIFSRLLEQMKSKAKSTSATHTRKRTYCINCLLKKF